MGEGGPDSCDGAHRLSDATLMEGVAGTHDSVQGMRRNRGWLLPSRCRAPFLSALRYTEATHALTRFCVFCSCLTCFSCSSSPSDLSPQGHISILKPTTFTGFPCNTPSVSLPVDSLTFVHVYLIQRRYDFDNTWLYRCSLLLELGRCMGLFPLCNAFPGVAG